MEQETAAEIDERLASLSERQREVLRLVSRDRNSKEIARELGLSDETVKNHIKAATRRLGVNSRFDAARLVRLQEQGDPRVVIDPSRVIAFSPHPASEVPSGDGGPEAEVREHRTSFDFHDRDFDRMPPAPRPGSGDRDAKPSALRVVTLIAVLTVAVAVAVISAAPLAKSVQDLANMIEPPTRQS
jgi:DNA-binding CsgD family transcriptional regulator